MDNIRKAIENGLPDAEWANAMMRELKEEHHRLTTQPIITGSAPQIDVETALFYRLNLDKVLQEGTPAEKKRLIRACVDKITMTPESLEVKINYKLPEAIGAYGGSGGALRCYLHRTCNLAGQKVSVG